MTHNHSLNIFRNPSMSSVLELLQGASLPTDDITPARLADFFGCGPERAPEGVVGLEVYDTFALSVSSRSDRPSPSSHPDPVS